MGGAAIPKWEGLALGLSLVSPTYSHSRLIYLLAPPLGLGIHAKV